MILRYIHHDCFVIETRRTILIFDFWKAPRFPDFPFCFTEAPEGEPQRSIYVFVSHHHKDHFRREIFEWAQRRPDIRFIISRDVEKYVRYMLREGGTYRGFRPERSQVTVMREGESFEDENLKVEAFGSTDIGNSYMVTVDGKRIFHAGDLNAWVWKDESTPAEIEAALRDFNAVLAPIEARYSSIDLAMFPEDPRLGRDYDEGARIFRSRFDIGWFVPMHYELV